MAHGSSVDEKKLAATQVFVTRQYKIGKKEGLPQGEEEVLAVHRFATEPARVEVSLGITLNLGNFESAKVSVGIVIPCYKEEADAAFNWGKDWVASRVKSEIQEIKLKKDTNII